MTTDSLTILLIALIALVFIFAFFILMDMIQGYIKSQDRNQSSNKSVLKYKNRYSKLAQSEEDHWILEDENDPVARSIAKSEVINSL